MQNIDYEAVRARVDQRIASQTNIRNSIIFVINLVVYILFTVISVIVLGNRDVGFGGAIDAVESALIYAWLGWGACILFYGVTLLMKSPRQIQKIRQQLTEQELGKMAIEAAGDVWLEKPKRHLLNNSESEMEMNDDGELIEIDEVGNTPQTRRNSHDTF